jgi:ribosome-binding factor A
MTESTRQLKVAKLIQKELGDLFQRDGSSYYGNAFVTLTKVKMSPDLGLAKVYLSFMLVENKKQLLETLSSHTKEIRKSLGERIRKQVRIIPDLQFYIDDNLEYANQMDELFAKIKIPPKPEDTSAKEEESDEDQ